MPVEFFKKAAKERKYIDNRRSNALIWYNSKVVALRNSVDRAEEEVASIYNERKAGTLLVLLAVLTAERRRRRSSIRRRRQRALPFCHQVGCSTLKLGRSQLGNCRPGNAFGDTRIKCRSRIQIAKARNVSAHDEVVINEIRKGRTVPSAGSRAATLCNR